MQKSFMERVFPHSPGPVLPKYKNTRSPGAIAQSQHSAPSIVLREESPSPVTSRSRSVVASKSSARLRPAPLSAATVHHNDPFTPIDRAAKALQNNIQAFLDAQTEGLERGLAGAHEDGLSSASSVTPTASMVASSMRVSVPRTIPIRQPQVKKITLRKARKGLCIAMHDLSTLKAEELRIIESQVRMREGALDTAKSFDDRRDALLQDMHASRSDGADDHAASLRKEAQDIDTEIRELEDRLFSLRARQSNLLQQADQTESAVASKLSSYQSSVALIDQKVKEFLRHPPVHQSLPSTASELRASGMYALKPDRRTLGMAKDQWTTEKTSLSNRSANVLEEQQALLEGEQIWHDLVQKITAFERELRAQTIALSQPKLDAPSASEASEGVSTGAQLSIVDILSRLDDVISNLESQLDYATARSWNLLVCCIAPELETFRQARTLLIDTHAESREDVLADSKYDHPDQLSEGGLLEGQNHNRRGEEAESPGRESNRSLEDTLKEFNSEHRDRLRSDTEQMALDGLQLRSPTRT